MATRYWVGGSGDWSDTAKWSTTSGGAGGASVPTSVDDAIINSSSGSPVINLSNVAKNCLSITTTGATCTIGTSVGSATLNVFGNVTLSSTTTVDSDVEIVVQSTSTVSLNNAAYSGDLVIDATGATVTLGSNFTGSATQSSVILTNGTFSTGSNYSVTAFIFSSSSTNTRTLTLNASSITLGTGSTFEGVFNMGSGTGLTLNAGTSNINIVGGAVNFTGGGKTYHNVTFTLSGSTFAGPAVLNGANTYNSLSILNTATSPFVANVQVSANQTITGTFTANCDSSLKRLRIITGSYSTQVTITAGTTSLSYVDFQGIIGAGTAAWTGTLLGNIGNNSGITFPASVNRYAKTAGASVGFINITWSATSGGAGGASIPLPQDSVFFDANSGASTYTLDYLICTDLNFTGFTGIIDISSSLYGNVLASGNVTVPSTGEYRLLDLDVVNSTTKTLTANSNSTIGQLNIGTTQYYGTNTATSLTCSGTSDISNLYLYAGTFTAGAGGINTRNVYLSETTNSRTLNMGSGTWTLSSTTVLWDASAPTGLTLNKQTANIVIDATDTSVTFDGGGLDYPKITFAGTTASQVFTFSGNNTIAELASTKTNAYTIRFTAGSTTTVAAFTVSGTAGNVVTINSTTTSRATLIKDTPWNVGVNSTSSNSSGINLVAGDGVDYLAFSYITALPQASSFLIMF